MTPATGPTLAAPALWRFVLKLWRALPPEGNLFVSPYGIAAGLAMLEAGADGPTGSEIRRALGIERPLPEIGALEKELRRRREPAPWERSLLENAPDLRPEDLACRLEAAFALWTQSGLPAEPAYARLLAETVDGASLQADFAGDPAGASATINRWASERTAGLIRDMVSPGSLAPETRAVLGTALSFKARWKSEFDPAGTRFAPFHLPDGTLTEVPMMARTLDLRYGRLGDAQAAALPYRGGEIHMLLLVPPAGGISALEKSLEDRSLETLSGGLEPREVVLRMPRFKVRSSLQLVPPLRGLGVRRPFGPEAGFPAISPQPGFRVDEILHRTAVSVDETGTEAAAVTLATMAMAAPPQEQVHLTVDRPFLFAIVDGPTATPLFLGRLADPRPDQAPSLA